MGHPATGEETATVPVGENPKGLGVSDDGVRVTNRRSGTVALIDPDTDTVVATVEVQAEP